MDSNISREWFEEWFVRNEFIAIYWRGVRTIERCMKEQLEYLYELYKLWITENIIHSKVKWIDSI